MAIHCAAAEHGELIKKERKESSWVKLKAFPTNIGRPNKVQIRDHLVGSWTVRTTWVSSVGGLAALWQF